MPAKKSSTVKTSNDPLSPGRLQTLDGPNLPPDFPDIGFFQIDRIVFPGEYTTLTESELGSASRSTQWFQRNPRIYTIVLLDGRVVGYCTAMPLEDSVFQAILDGTLSDGEIPAAALKTFETPGPCKIYVCSLAILPEQRRNGATFRALYRAFFEKLLNLAKAGIYVTDLAAVAWTKDGASTCRKLGMKCVKRHEAHGEVYHCELRTLAESPPASALTALVQRYRELKLM